jgi:sulfite reductase alpha subunit-like flavoprotein
LSHFGNDKTLINLKYAVFALGSKQYPTFCAFGNYIDITLKSLGATQLIPIGLGDELSGQEKAFQLWANECYKTLCIHFQFDINFSFEEKSFDRQKVRIIEVFIEKNEHQIQKELAGLHSKDIIPFKIIKRVRLQPPQSESQTLFVRLSPSNAIDLNKFDYEPGDHFGIFPSNPKEIVNALLAHLSRTTRHDPNSSILQVQNLISGKWISDSRLPPCSLRVALTNYLDITTPPNQRFLQYLIDTTKDTWDSFRLKKLSSV